jgi:ABC-2 type transport system ATP-binding protein
MRVNEYLRFRGRLKGVARGSLKGRVGEVKQLCGLEDVGRRIIGQLSKGYRQRVGLAEALIHEPELLILDEPTIGLDPSQIRHVRELIRQLAQRHTVLLSTHILPEVEMTCQRVLIINEGKVIASDSPERLRARMQGGAQVRAEVQGPREEVKRQLGQLPGARNAEVTAVGDWLTCRVECDGDTDLRQAVFQLVAAHGWMLRDLQTERQSLEEVFLQLTAGDAVAENVPTPGEEEGTS